MLLAWKRCSFSTIIWCSKLTRWCLINFALVASLLHETFKDLHFIMWHTQMSLRSSHILHGMSLPLWYVGNQKFALFRTIDMLGNAKNFIPLVRTKFGFAHNIVYIIHMILVYSVKYKNIDFFCTYHWRLFPWRTSLPAYIQYFWSQSTLNVMYIYD